MLTEVEARRVLVLIEEANERLNLLRTISKSGAGEGAGGRTSNTMLALIKEQDRLQTRYGQLADIRDRKGNNAREGWSGKQRGAPAEVEQEVVETIENLRQCRSLIAKAMSKDDPESTRRLAEVNTERINLVEQLTQLAFDLNENDHGFASLKDKVEHHLEQDKVLKETLARQAIAEQDRTRLQEQLKQEDQRFAERESDLDAVITNLTDELRRVSDDLAVQAKLDADISIARINTVSRERHAAIDDLSAEATQLEAEMEREVRVAGKTKDFLEMMIEQNRTNLANWTTKFADELAEKKNELEQLTQSAVEVRAQLETLEERKRMEDDLAAKQEIAEREAKIQRAKDEAAALIHNAATTLQRAWRRSRQRRLERPGKKGKGKDADCIS